MVRRASAALGQHRSTPRKAPAGRDDKERLTADILNWPELLRLSQDCGTAEVRGLACEREAGGAHLAA